jgi:hypothetical protein
MAYPLPPITKVDFSSSQYIAEEHPKKQIYLHHTAGNSSAQRTFQGWNANADKIATCVAISGKGSVDGEIVQGFSSKHWAYHLGLKQDVFTKYKVPYQSLDKISIGIEICNWGWLTEKNGKFYTYVNSEVPKDQVIKLDTPYKNFTYWHDYTDAQIKSVKELLLLWNDRYNIPLDYNEDIWQVTPRALKGEPGVYTHNSVRVDKTDVYPHPGLIEMLKSL